MATTANRGSSKPVSEQDAQKVTTYNTLLDEYDAADAGYTTISDDTSNALTRTQCLNVFLKFTATLTANRTRSIPATGGFNRVYVIWNATSGAFTLGIKIGSGTALTITQGKAVILFHDGTTCYAFPEFTPSASATTPYIVGGTDVAIADGGTGQSTATAGFDALAPTTTRGDIIYRGASNNLRLAIGAATTLLHGGTDPAYSAVVEADITLADNTTNDVSSSKHGFFPKIAASALAAWTPTWSNLSVGNGTVSCKFVQIGKLVICRVSLVFGSTTSISGDVSFSNPVTAITYPGSSGLTHSGSFYAYDLSATTPYFGVLSNLSTTTTLTRIVNSSGTYLTAAAMSSTVPFTWATGDEIDGAFSYEAA